MLKAYYGGTMTVGEQIKRRRKVLGLSQEELSVKLNISRQTISKWEQDKSLPDLINGITLCEFLGISTEELLGKQTLSKNTVKEELIPIKFIKIFLVIIVLLFPLIYCRFFNYSTVYILIYYPFITIGFLINNPNQKNGNKILVPLIIGSTFALLIYYLSNPLSLVFNLFQEIILILIFIGLGKLIKIITNDYLNARN